MPGRPVFGWQIVGLMWELTYFLIAVCHRSLYLCSEMYDERLLREDTSNRELISKFVLLKVCGCTIEARAVHDDVLLT
jgi:hypothetical protein